MRAFNGDSYPGLTDIDINEDMIVKYLLKLWWFTS